MIVLAIDRFDLPQLRRAAAVVALAGAGVGLTAAFLDPVQGCRAYLVGAIFVIGFPLGSLALAMIHALTGGAWGEQLGPGLRAAIRALPLALVLFAPVLAMTPWIYPWAAADAHGHFQRDYLNVPFFGARSVGFAVIWLALSLAMRTSNPARRAAVSGVGLVLLGLTVTFAAIDWVMSLEAPWPSTMFPVLFATGQALQATALAVLLCMTTPAARALPAKSLRDLGNLLLMFVMLWAYMSISQYLLIWSGNLREEIPWYLRRLRGGWEWVALVLIVFQFALPFAVLLMCSVKERPAALASVALLVIAMRGVDVFWWIEAAPLHESLFFWIADVAMLAAIGGAWTWEFARRLEQEAAYEPARA